MGGARADIAILVLAAGSSSRMGQPKQLLPWRGTTLLENAVQHALASQAKDVFVVLGANAEIIHRRITEYAVEVIENPSWELGLGSSIARGIDYLQQKEMEYDGLLVMLADQPLIDTDYLNVIIASFTETLNSIVATGYKSRAGVPALFDKKYFGKLRKLTNDKFGAKKIINQSDDDVLVVDAGAKSVDVDTPSAYKNLIQNLK